MSALWTLTAVGTLLLRGGAIHVKEPEPRSIIIIRASLIDQIIGSLIAV